MGEKSTTQLSTEVAARGFPVAIGSPYEIKLEARPIEVSLCLLLSNFGGELLPEPHSNPFAKHLSGAIHCRD